MSNKDRIFIGACCGLPLGMVGVAIGSLFAFIFNKIIGRNKVKYYVINTKNCKCNE